MFCWLAVIFAVLVYETIRNLGNLVKLMLRFLTELEFLPVTNI